MSDDASHREGAISGSSERSAEFNFHETFNQATGRASEVVARRPSRAAAQPKEVPVDPKIAIIEAAATIVLSSLRDGIKKTRALPIKFLGWSKALDEAGCRDDPQRNLKRLQRRVVARIGELCVTTTGQLEKQNMEIQGECSPSLIAPGLNY
jgi:hypothetical protein